MGGQIGSKTRQDGSVEETAHLQTASTSVVLSSVDGRTPTLLYWGTRLEDADVDGLALAASRPIANASLNVEASLGLLTELGDGFPGSPGIAGHRPEGGGYGPTFGEADFIGDEAEGAQWVTCRLSDPVSELELCIELTLGGNGEVRPTSVGRRRVQVARADILTVALTLTNTGSTPYTVDRLAPSIQLPNRADELLTFSGRWTLEFQPTRRRWEPGAWTAENWRGRTSHDRPPALFAGSAGFTEDTGEVWGLQLGWSGNNRMLAERLSDGRRHIQLGEQLFSGEVVLEPEQSLRTPTIYGTYSASGLSEASLAYHRLVRSRPHHPGVDRPRPVLLNTWEAVYFDHDVKTLQRLASYAAEVGVERFVLDDGWFLGRNDDTAALGDWTVDPVKYPNGLDPLIAHVRQLGMDFGLWFEPEMVNPDSELFRSHPEWALHDERYPLRLGRNQLVLDLVNPDAWKYVLDRLDGILRHYEISYIKWDMNRDVVRPTLDPDGRAGARAQTLAFYALVDEIRRLHPRLEIESCASGGARADLEVLGRTTRIWPSDSNDALDRQAIQRGFSMLFPPEVMGAHIGPPVSHTTGRRHDLSFRWATAMLGHLGIEWNLLQTTAEERAELALLISLHKEHRSLIHGGDWRRLDSPDGATNTMGVVAPDGGKAIFVYARTATTPESVHAPVRFTHLDPDRVYAVHSPRLPGRGRDRGAAPPPWIVAAHSPESAVAFSGRVLMEVGLQMPILDPESALLLVLHAQ